MQLPFSLTDQVYSEIDFSSLENALAQTGREIHLEKGMTIQSRPNEILVLMSGLMCITNDKENGMDIGHAPRLMPSGLIEYYYPFPLYYRMESPVTVYQLTKEEFDNVFLHNTVHAELLCRIMTNMVAMLTHVYYERNNESRYATIRNMIYRYHARINSGSLEKESIVSFILKRTRLSRSYIFQILAELKAGGYITMQKGKIISINRYIPERY